MFACLTMADCKNAWRPQTPRRRIEGAPWHLAVWRGRMAEEIKIHQHCWTGDLILNLYVFFVSKARVYFCFDFPPWVFRFLLPCLEGFKPMTIFVGSCFQACSLRHSVMGLHVPYDQEDLTSSFQFASPPIRVCTGTSVSVFASSFHHAHGGASVGIPKSGCCFFPQKFVSRNCFLKSFFFKPDVRFDNRQITLTKPLLSPVDDLLFELTA